MNGQELRWPAQLPEIEGPEFWFTWDQHDDESVITYGSRLVWRERTGWEVYERFEEIAVVLQRKYGARLRDLVPTPGSTWALFGDSSRAAGHVAAVRAMLASGAPRHYSFAELDRAVELLDIGLLRLYLLSGADPDIADPDTGVTLLHLAAARRKPTLVRLLLEFGAAPNHLAHDRRTALCAALEGTTAAAASRYDSETLEVVRALVGAGAALSCPTTGPSGTQMCKPPLALAARHGHADVLSFLLEHGAPLEDRDTGGMTALHDALLYGWTAAAQRLLVAGANPNATYGPRATTALLLAVRPLEQVDQAAVLVRLLVRAGAVLDQADCEGVTPLLAAVHEGRFDLVLVLLALGADARHRDRAGQGVLHRLPWAVRHTVLSSGQIVALIEALRAAGADPTARDRAGMTAAEQAQVWGQNRLAGLLQGGPRPRWLPPDLPEAAERFQKLSASAKKRVHEYLCAKVLEAWLRYALAAGDISYNDSVVGMVHCVDLLLPVDAFLLVFGELMRVSPAFTVDALEQRYREPIVALQDDDLGFEAGILLGYYAIYNAFVKYALNRPIDDWLIVYQAVSVFPERYEWDLLLQTAFIYADVE